MLDDIPSQFFDMLPLPILVVKHLDDDLNHPLVYQNKAFKQQIGWDIQEIPDKQTWWQTAYPDENYQRAIQHQWELAVELAMEKQAGFVSIEVNIATKHEGLQRYNVFTEIHSNLLPGYYVVAFEPISTG